MSYHHKRCSVIHCLLEWNKLICQQVIQSCGGNKPLCCQGGSPDHGGIEGRFYGEAVLFHLFAERLQNDLSRVEEPAGIGDADRNFNREVQFAANGYGGFSQFCGGAAIDIQRGGVSCGRPAGLPAEAGPEVRNYFEPPFEDTRKRTNLW